MGGSGELASEGRVEPTGLAHFTDADSVFDRLESRQAERRRLDRRDAEPGAAAAADDFPTRQSRELCHDLRQPLAVIAAIMAGLDSEPGLSVTGRRRLEQVLEQTERLSRLVTGCLSPPQQVAVDLLRVVESVAYSGRITYTGTLDVIGSDHPVVLGDPILLDRALTNVLDNACRAAGPNGVVRIVLWSASSGARVDVDDDGPGFGPSASSAGHGSRAGHGLGLTIVQAVLDQHGGTLTMGPGPFGGTRVRLRLPVLVPAQDHDGPR